MTRSQDSPPGSWSLNRAQFPSARRAKAAPSGPARAGAADLLPTSRMGAAPESAAIHAQMRRGPWRWPSEQQVLVRDPMSGQTVLATAFNGYIEQVKGQLNADGVLDACHLLRPGRRLTELPADRMPSWHLVRDGASTFLFPLLPADGRAGQSGKESGGGPAAA